MGTTVSQSEPDLQPPSTTDLSNADQANASNESQTSQADQTHTATLDSTNPSLAHEVDVSSTYELVVSNSQNELCNEHRDVSEPEPLKEDPFPPLQKQSESDLNQNGRAATEKPPAALTWSELVKAPSGAARAAAFQSQRLQSSLFTVPGVGADTIILWAQSTPHITCTEELMAIYLLSKRDVKAFYHTLCDLKTPPEVARCVVNAVARKAEQW